MHKTHISELQLQRGRREAAGEPAPVRVRQEGEQQLPHLLLRGDQHRLQRLWQGGGDSDDGDELGAGVLRIWDHCGHKGERFIHSVFFPEFLFLKLYLDLTLDGLIKYFVYVLIPPPLPEVRESRTLFYKKERLFLSSL